MYRCGKTQLGCLRDAAGPNAGSADTNVHAHAFNHGADTLKIWIPAAAPCIVGVTDHVAERRPLAANLASHSHDNSLPIHTKLNKVSSLAEFWPIRTRFDSLGMGESLISLFLGAHLHYGTAGGAPIKPFRFSGGE